VTGFGEAWNRKFSEALEAVCGLEIVDEVMKGVECTADGTSEDVTIWTDAAMRRLERLSGVEKAREVLTRCACIHPKEGLGEIIQIWKDTGSIDRVLEALQKRFEDFLRHGIKLTEDEMEFFTSRDMGLAGRREGSTIFATKIPKSGFLREYISEQDPLKRRALYCHCPRIRDAVAQGAKISPLYCYCSAGFYKALWEDILGMPVEVEVLESILDGGDVCRMAVHLPAEDAE